MELAMNQESRGAGWVVILSALVLQLSWVILLCFMAEMTWVTPGLVGTSHWLALVFMIVAPLVYGLTRSIRASGDEEPGSFWAVTKSWLLSGFLPLALYVVALKAFLHYSFQPSVGGVVALMFAVLPLLGYGAYLLMSSEEDAD